MNRCRAVLLALFCATGATALLASCGGGGPGSASSSSSGSAGGGVKTSCNGTSTNTSTSNVVPLVVDSVCGGVNQAYVTLQVCMPGSTSACRTIDHVWVDTGSTGLRILNSALTLGLPASGAQNGNVVGNCGQFISGYVWGAMRQADVYIGGESAMAAPIQVIGDVGLPAAPSTCAMTGQDFGSVSKLSANGILGIGLTQQDCGLACVSGTTAPAGAYYTCPGGNCSSVFVPASQQLQNIAGLFPPPGNNGVELLLPALPAAGQSSATGSLVFGIPAQAGGLGSATIFAADPNPANPTYLDLVTTFNNGSFPQSYIDSGSNAWFFDDTALTVCGANQPAGFFCQAASGLAATMQGAGGGNSFTYTFNVANANALSSSFSAFNNLAGPASSNGQTGVTFDWGLPFFYGRSVYFAIEQRIAGGTTGPFYAATTP